MRGFLTVDASTSPHVAAVKVIAKVTLGIFLGMTVVGLAGSGVLLASAYKDIKGRFEQRQDGTSLQSAVTYIPVMEDEVVALRSQLQKLSADYELLNNQFNVLLSERNQVGPSH